MTIATTVFTHTESLCMHVKWNYKLGYPTILHTYGIPLNCFCTINRGPGKSDVALPTSGCRKMEDRYIVSMTHPDNICLVSLLGLTAVTDE